MLDIYQRTGTAQEVSIKSFVQFLKVLIYFVGGIFIVSIILDKTPLYLLSGLVNGRRMTNIGTFRAYVTAYLRHHPMINQEMTLMVRQLTPTEHGLPIEIYAFCRDVAWVAYEGVQADIFDHIFAIVPQFDLRLFQAPAGRDFRQWTGRAPA